METHSFISSSKRPGVHKILLFIFSACLVFLVGDYCFGYITDWILCSSDFRFARLYSGRLQGDVIVLGNSRAVNGFYTPRISKLTNDRWVNLGYNGMGPSLVEVLLLDYLDRYPAPRAVILEVSNIMQGDASIRDCRLFARKSPRFAVIDQKVNSEIGFLAAHVNTFAANGEMLMRCMYYLMYCDQDWVNEGRIVLEQAASLSEKEGRRLEGAVLPESLRITKRMIKELHQRGIPTWCVVTPYLLNEKDRIHAQSWLNQVKEADDVGVHYVNWVENITNPQLYADPSHLNRQGAISFADVVACAYLEHTRLTSQGKQNGQLE